MKRFYGIIFFIVLIAPFLGSYFLFQYQKKQLRREVKQMVIAGAKNDELCLLKFSKAKADVELEWEHDHEFEYKGEMYDVVKSKVVGDTIYYHCWKDDKETALEKKLDRLLADLAGDDQNESKETHKNIFSLIKKLYFINEFNLEFNVKDNDILYADCQDMIYHIFLNSPAVPPPEFI